MYREARLFIRTLIDTIERLVVVQVSDQINKGREDGILPHEYHLTPRILDELHAAGNNLVKLVVKRRWKAYLILPAIWDYQEKLDLVTKLYEEDHEDRDGRWQFCPRKKALDIEGTSKWPKSRKEVLKQVATLRRSTQFALIRETGYAQSTVSEAITDLELAGFVNQVEIRPVVDGSPENTRENLVTLTGAGKTLCSILFDKELERSIATEMDDEQADHALFVNIILAVKDVKAKSRYFGETAKECRVESSIGDGDILPDGIIDLDHRDSQRGEDLPLEAEYRSNITALKAKANRYRRSDAERVVIVCRSKKMARHYKDYLFKEFKSLRAWYSKQTTFEFFYLKWQPGGYVLGRIGSIVI